MADDDGGPAAQGEIECAQCRHLHPAEVVDDLLGNGAEMMCQWCVRGDYGHDPKGDYTKPFSAESSK